MVSAGVPMQIDPDTRDHYRVLGVPRDASRREIRRAYRHLARQHHPDTSPHPRDSAHFTALTAAYEVLHDPNKRARYDRASHRPQTPDDQRQPPHWTEPDPTRRSAERPFRPLRSRDRQAVLELSPREAALLAAGPLTVHAGGYTIELPAGTRPGQHIRLAGGGERGWLGGPPGEVLLTIEVCNSRLTAGAADVFDLLLALRAASNSSIHLSGGRFTWQ